jgi:hypothetical protein
LEEESSCQSHNGEDIDVEGRSAMKIMILGTGKSGTTAMVYKLAGGLSKCQAFSGGKPGKYVGDYENAVYKHTYEERKGKTFELYREHLTKEQYDRKIWMARDPRDTMVSRMLYRWQRGIRGHKDQYRAHLDLILKKERDPRSIPFYEVCRYIGFEGWPISAKEVVEAERFRYQRMREFVAGLGNDWLLFKYEDMIANNYDVLNKYLGFEVKVDAEVPESTGKAKVVRKKATGDWRHWFTEEDVERFKPAYLPYMEIMGYDCKDWTLDPNPVIEAAYSSEYMIRLAKNANRNVFLSFKDALSKKLFK